MRTQLFQQTEDRIIVEYFTVRNREGKLLYGANLYIKNDDMKPVRVQQSSHNKNFLIMDLKRIYGVSTDREMRYQDFKKWFNSIGGRIPKKLTKKIQSKFAYK